MGGGEVTQQSELSGFEWQELQWLTQCHPALPDPVPPLRLCVRMIPE